MVVELEFNPTSVKTQEAMGSLVETTGHGESVPRGGWVEPRVGRLGKEAV